MNDLAERSVIGSLFMDIGALQKIYDILKPGMFQNPLLGDIYREIVKDYDLGSTVNLVTISQRLESEALPREAIARELKGCVSITVTSAEIASYAETVVNDYKARAFAELVRRVQIQPAMVETQIAGLIQELEQLKTNEARHAKELSAIVAEYGGQYFVEHQESKLYTGFPRLDDITGGLEGGDVIVIGARPAVGKSAFVSQVVLQMARAGKRVGFYNLEMSDKQVYERLLSNQSGIQLHRIRRAVKFLGEEQRCFCEANEALQKMNVLISSGTKSISEIRNECRHQELDCIIIDYLQLVRADVKYQSRASEVGAISKAVKALAMELGIPIVALSQLNRVSESRENKEPSMGELREAGDIEQDASIIMLMWNPDPADTTKKALKVDKNRQGETCRLVYRFNGSRMCFEETGERIEDIAKGFRPAKEPTPFD